MHSLKEILEFEDKGEFIKALDAYEHLYSTDPLNYNVWKHYFFLLWEVVEEVAESVLLEYDVRSKMRRMITEGYKKFESVADFNFIAGYAVAMFPYEFGKYQEQLQTAKQLLNKAYRLEPANKIYQYMCNSFSEEQNERDLNTLKQEALHEIRETFSGIGILNKYFRQVLLPNGF
jgi:tetratricopeptide (TPR) repeat protein